MAVAAIGAAIPAADSLVAAVEMGIGVIPPRSACAAAARLAADLALAGDGPGEIHRRYGTLSPVHSVNNLALVVWGLLAGEHDYSTAVGDTVAAGWDTDCNGATVGGLWGLTGREIPRHWTEPWRGRVAVTLAGVGELALADLVSRTVAVADAITGIAASD
jgi:ADP-ribosylglycohydrolase